MVTLAEAIKIIDNVSCIKPTGRVKELTGLVLKAKVPGVHAGEICYIQSSSHKAVRAEVVGFQEDTAILMPLGDIEGIGVGSEVIPTGQPLTVKVGEMLLGRVLNGLGEPLDIEEKGPLITDEEYPVYNYPPDPLKRQRITTPIALGIRAIDGLLTCGEGQRIGIFAGSGVGKSTLLGMLARNTGGGSAGSDTADVNVISLIGERGREVVDFIEESLGEEGLKKSVLVVATSDQPPLVRLKGAFVGTAIAEYFRDKGKKVLFMMDSVTRFALAQREVGLASGEPPTTRGFTPSVFALLPRLMERAGTSQKGSITAFYTVLVEGDDFNEPICDAVRGILDGHIILSRDLAAKNHYPCIDILRSVSRLMNNLVSLEHKKAAGKLREVLATYKEAEDLINIGAYKPGNQRIDYAISKIDEVNNFLRQNMYEKISFKEVVERLIQIFKE